MATQGRLCLPSRTIAIGILSLLAFNGLVEAFVASSPNHPQHHAHANKERPEDGFNAHMEGNHNQEYDHEAILGSHKEAQEFDDLPPEQAKAKLRKLVTEKMDQNKDGKLSRDELIEWIIRSFKSLSEEEARDQFEDEDKDRDGAVSWTEHLKDMYQGEDGLNEEELLKDVVVQEDKELFDAADVNKDSQLDMEEYPAFYTPEEYPHMHETLYKQMLRNKDKDKDGKISMNEFLTDHNGTPLQPATEQYVSEKDRFLNDYDKNRDGQLDQQEVYSWIIPSDKDIAEAEADHLIGISDDDNDGQLSVEEVVAHHDTFVGSEATDYGEQLRHQEL